MWKLMSDDAITKEERELLSNFILTSDKLTQGNKVREFEQAWSEWLGCKYSVFVNSGSSANLLLVQAAHDLYNERKGDWIAQSMTWATNIAPIMQLKGCSRNLHLVDINLENLGPDLNLLEQYILDNDIQFIFLTHLLGIPAFSERLIEICKENDVMIFEDCCESHGASWQGKKVGTIGKASTFSFYYGHHMTTIEGGMICTDDKEFYERLLLLRSHGLLRELPKESQEQNKVEGVNEKFTFLCPGYNVRSTELNAVLGLSQIQKMDTVVERRNENFIRFIENLNGKNFHINFPTKGVSSFAFPIICKEEGMINKVETVLKELDIEYRPLIAGNLFNHPMCKSLNCKMYAPNSEHIHNNSFYVGNSEFIDINMIDTLTNKLNEL
tara:strand:- start:232 stop:1383 length:1152 start_codon:yes stop_codon:yes gene_type:complete